MYNNDLKNGNKRARGGKRKGAGRKPSAYTQLRERIIEESVDEARKSFDFLIQLRDNPDEPSALRKEAALCILDRVLGKSKERLEHSGGINLDHIDVIMHDGGTSDSNHRTDLQ